MAFDGLVIANIVHELNDALQGGRINKIAQPEKDELILTIKGQAKEPYRLLISADAGLPLVYLTDTNKQNPLTAPNFCMLLRKHLNNARILSITQPDFERIIHIKLEHLDEMGDLREKYLIIELMGKHSNIIFCDDNRKIIDSIKRINQFISSIREVLPGRDYFIPVTAEKFNPLEVDFITFQSNILTKPMPVYKALYNGLTGISPLIANEICFRASIEPELPPSELSEAAKLHLFGTLERLMEDIKNANFTPNVIYKEGNPVEFSSVELKSYQGFEVIPYSSVSAMLANYYARKSSTTRIRQKSSDLRKIVSTALDRTSKKLDLQIKQMKDTEKRDKYKVYGELITAYGYELEPEAKVLKALNYYNNEEIAIPLDPLLTPLENAKRYFEKYSKLKRTSDALTNLIQETKDELTHLESIQTALDIATDEEDLTQIKGELTDYGYIKKRGRIDKKSNSKKASGRTKPLHYLSSEGFHMYVGKNNFQNDELTFQFADGGDWWFHVKKAAGSHVIVKSEGKDLPDSTFEEAARLAAHYSSMRDSDKAEIDYTLRKNVKKPSGGKPGFVVYYTNYSMVASTNISGITLIS